MIVLVEVQQFKPSLNKAVGILAKKIIMYCSYQEYKLIYLIHRCLKQHKGVYVRNYDVKELDYMVNLHCSSNRDKDEGKCNG
jgi:hypothetical protein